MKRPSGIRGIVVGCLCLGFVTAAGAQDWPQWRGPHRDAKASGFRAPASWPKELSKKWQVEVGDGVATPALVAGKLYVFARQGGDEVIRCLDASTGQEIWQDKYPSVGVSGPASSFPGPRSSPTVAEGKVVALGVNGTVSCLDAVTGKLLWRKDDYRGVAPQFFTSSSPLIVDGICLVQLGGGGRGSSSGGVVAYDLATGDHKWEWKGDAPAYGSPVLMDVTGDKVAVMPTANRMVALRVADGRELWSVVYSQGRYNAATPIVAGDTLVYAGPNRGISAEKLQKKEEALDGKILWTNDEHSLIYNTPVLKDGLLYGISTTNTLFCVHADDGKSAWSVPLTDPATAGGGEKAAPQPRAGGQSPSKGPGKKGRGGRGGGGGAAGYGSVVDAGSVLLALTPAGQLVVLEPGSTQFKQVAHYKVADGGTYAYPVVSGSRLFIKDRNSVIQYSLE